MKRSMLVIPVLLFLSIVGYMVWFGSSHGELVRNRYTDAWWHIAAADEWARTGVFAKDPFYMDAPLFANFGLMDLVGGNIAQITGLSAESIFPHLHAMGIGISLLALYIAIYSLVSHHLAALSGAVAQGFWLARGDHFLTLGLPFSVACSLLLLFAVLLWKHLGKLIDNSTCLGLRCFVLGLLVGAIFGIHSFVGFAGLATLFGVGVVHVLKGTAWRQIVRSLAIIGLGMLVLSWPWWWLHLTLRPFLALHNAHATVYSGSSASLFSQWPHLLALAIAGGCAMLSNSRTERLLSWALLVILLGLLLGLHSPVRRMITSATSPFMTERLLMFFPVGILVALVMSSQSIQPRLRWVLQGISVVAFVCIPMVPVARTHLYLNRTSDYDSHPYAYLRTLKEFFPFSSHRLLADPYTSYFARGMLGTYAVTVPSGHSSPAVDAAARSQLAARLLNEGPSQSGQTEFDAVIFDKRNRLSNGFLRVPIGEAAIRWDSAGWITKSETDQYLLLTKPLKVP